MRGLKVMLVDDELEFIGTLAERLTIRGFEVKTATSGEEGLQAAREDPPDVMVLDVRMPGLGGMEVLRRMRTDHPEVPVILLTGLGSTQDGMEGMNLGAVDFLMKPIKIETLIEKIQEATENRKRATT